MANSRNEIFNTQFYRTWLNMRTRCNNKKTPNYNCYGGRGIKVCKRWNKFVNFYEDMKTGFQENLTLDRINNNKGYSMNNCRWTGRKQQAINRRNTRLLGFNGQKKREQEVYSGH